MAGQDKEIDLAAGLVPKSDKSNPGKIDISAGLVPSSANPSRPADVPTIGALSESDITANPHHEGTYAMVNADGRTVQIPYSQVRGSGDPKSDAAKTTTAIKNLGYRFANDSEQKRFLKDLSADPVYGAEGYGNGVVGWMHEHGGDLTVGALREGAKSAAGLSDVGNKLIDYLAGHPVHGMHSKSTDELNRRVRELAQSEPRNTAEKLGGLGENVAEIVVPEAEIGKLGKVGKAAEVLESLPGVKGVAARAVIEGTKAAGEQGAQAFVKSGGDTEEAKRGALYGAVGGAGLTATSDALSGIGKFSKNSLRHRFDVDETGTKKIIADATKENDEIAKDAAKIHSENVAKIKAARDAGDKAEAARLEHDDLTTRHQAIETKRSNLQYAIERTRKSIADRVQTINNASQAYFKKGFEDVRKRLDAPDPKIGGPHSVSYAKLDADVNEAEGNIKGTRENVRLFNDIRKKSQGVETEHNLTREEVADLDPDELNMLHTAGAKYSDLDGYYQEAGRMIGNPSTAPDVKQALVKFRKSLEKRMQDLAEEVDPKAAAEHKLLRSQYREYAEGFKDYSGPADSGSPVAKGLQAKDPYNATKPYLDLKQPEEIARGRSILVGDKSKAETQFTGPQIAESYDVGPDRTYIPKGKMEPAWRYRKDTHALVEHLRNLESGLASLPKSDVLEEEAAKSAEAVEKASGEARKTGQPVIAGKVEPGTARVTKEELPKSTQMTPQQLQEKKAEILKTNAHNLGKFGTWVAVGGLVGGLATFTETGNWQKSLKGMAGGMAMGMMAPHLLYQLLKSPASIRILTKVTQDDLRQLGSLPKDQRAGVEEAIKALADEAVKRGILQRERIPWYRIIGGEAGRKVTEPSAAPAAIAGQDTDIQKELDKMESKQ